MIITCAATFRSLRLAELFALSLQVRQASRTMPSDEAYCEPSSRDVKEETTMTNTPLDTQTWERDSHELYDDANINPPKHQFVDPSKYHGVVNDGSKPYTEPFWSSTCPSSTIAGNSLRDMENRSPENLTEDYRSTSGSSFGSDFIHELVADLSQVELTGVAHPSSEGPDRLPQDSRDCFQATFVPESDGSFDQTYYCEPEVIKNDFFDEFKRLSDVFKHKRLQSVSDAGVLESHLESLEKSHDFALFRKDEDNDMESSPNYRLHDQNYTFSLDIPIPLQEDSVEQIANGNEADFSQPPLSKLDNIINDTSSASSHIALHVEGSPRDPKGTIDNGIAELHATSISVDENHTTPFFREDSPENSDILDVPFDANHPIFERRLSSTKPFVSPSDDSNDLQKGNDFVQTVYDEEHIIAEDRVSPSLVVASPSITDYELMVSELRTQLQSTTEALALERINASRLEESNRALKLLLLARDSPSVDASRVGLPNDRFLDSMHIEDLPASEELISLLQKSSEVQDRLADMDVGRRQDSSIVVGSLTMHEKNVLLSQRLEELIKCQKQELILLRQELTELQQTSVAREQERSQMFDMSEEVKDLQYRLAESERKRQLTIDSFSHQRANHTAEISAWITGSQELLLQLSEWTSTQKSLQASKLASESELRVSLSTLQEHISELQARVLVAEGDLQNLERVRLDQAAEFQFNWNYVANVLIKFLNASNEQRVCFLCDYYVIYGLILFLGYDDPSIARIDFSHARSHLEMPSSFVCTFPIFALSLFNHY